MKNSSGVALVVGRMLMLSALAACSQGSDVTLNQDAGYVVTPTVDYVEGLDVYAAPHKDSFCKK